MDRLTKMGMHVDPGKTSWAVDEVDYLGFTIAWEGIRPQHSKVDTILQILAPRSQKEVRHFLGLVNFIRSLIKRG